MWKINNKIRYKYLHGNTAVYNLRSTTSVSLWWYCYYNLNEYVVWLSIDCTIIRGGASTNEKMSGTKVAIIGCGFSGLSAIRRCVEMNLKNCMAFELSSEVGGLWVYTEKIGIDDFGIPIQTSLYHSLRYVKLVYLFVNEVELIIEVEKQLIRKTAALINACKIRLSMWRCVIWTCL